MACFELRQLSFTYPGQQQAALNDVSCVIPAGQFVAVCGASGCGKTTLLRLLKPALAPHGTRGGEICFEDQPLTALDARAQAARIGFVLQNPDNQLVTDKVWHELAFGLEGLGCDTATIRTRVAEMASFFGIEGWFYRPVAELSGGQKQLLNLASIMAMQPSALILDEPTSQLDPIAAGEFLSALGKINRELGTTVIISEHRLEEVLPLADRVLMLEQGRLIGDGAPREIGMQLQLEDARMFRAMPVAMRIWAATPNEQPCPLTVRDGRAWLNDFAATHPLRPLPPASIVRSGETLAVLDAVWFKYGRELPDVLKGVSMRVCSGEMLAVLGGNGAGKSTLLSVLGGQRKPYRGEVKQCCNCATLPQNPQTLFVKKTVREDLAEMLREIDLPPDERDQRISRVVQLCRLSELLARHPYDLSGGEQQRAALAKVLLLEPRLLLLDEPTKGLDADFKQELAQILRHLTAQGVGVVMVSHDVEFCAEYAHRCALFFDGDIVTAAPPREFFSGNSFYTTATNRMARQLAPQAVTVADVIALTGGEQPPYALLTERELPAPMSAPPVAVASDKLPRWRRWVAAVSGCAVLVMLITALRMTDLTQLINANGLSTLAGDYVLLYAVLLVALLVLALALGRGKTEDLPQIPRCQRKLPRRTRVALVMILLLIPLTIFVGVAYFDSRKYFFIALMILMETMLPFALSFEGRKPQARELVLIAVLCAIGVAGRAAFFMLPGFKPVLALVIISGVALGGESGFLIGAMTMLVSNILLGQGPWTPWQMFAMGIAGFLSGVLFRHGWLRRSRLSLCLFGFIAALVVYGGIMNPAAALMYQSVLTKEILLTYYLTGVPVDLVHGASTVVFLWFLSQPMLEKLDRIKLKYGMLTPEEDA